MKQAKSLRESTMWPPFRWRAAIVGRLKGPGGVYNLGNAIGFGAGLFVAFLGTPESANSFTNVLSIGTRYVAGSPAAVALTIATAIFFWNGEVYHRGWSNGYPPDPKLTRLGDLLSGFGAIALGAGLYLLGNPLLAASSGALHAAGKFGSAFNLSGGLSFAGLKIDASTVCRNIVLISRVPAIIASTADVLSSKAQADGPFAIHIFGDACLLLDLGDSRFDAAFARQRGDQIVSPRPGSENPRLVRLSVGASKSQPCVTVSPQYSYSAPFRPSPMTSERTAKPSRAGSSRRAADQRTRIISGPIRSRITLAATMSSKPSRHRSRIVWPVEMLLFRRPSNEPTNEANREEN